MIYDSAVEEAKDTAQTQKPAVALATVTSISDGRAILQFNGETEPSSKLYPYVEGYKPTVGDTICLLIQGNTYIIVGKISQDNITTNYKPNASEISSDYLSITDAAATYLTIVDAGNNYRGENDPFDQIKNGNRSMAMSSTGLVTPDATGNVTLGSTSKKFKGVFSDLTADTTATQYLRRYTNIYDGFDLDSDGMFPHTNSGASIGSSSKQLLNLYAKNIYLNGSPISSSDKRKKKSIKDLARKYKELLFRLCPVSYKYKDGTNERTHTGFIAQEVEQAAADVGIELKDLAAVVIEKNGNYGIRYEEFIAIITAVVQDHECELRDLHDLVTDQQAQIDELRRELINIKKSMK